MKKLKNMYGIPVTAAALLVGITLIMLNPEINNGGGLDLPDWAFDVAAAAGILFLVLAAFLLINTFRKENQ